MDIKKEHVMALTNIRDKKINLFTFFLSNVIFLGLMFAVSLVARAGSEQEIGEPYFNLVTHRHITLAPDGKTFYAVEGRNAVVSRYQLSPFKKIDSFKIPKLKFPFGPNNASRMFIANGGKNIIFYNTKSLMLFDLHAKKIIKKVEFDRFGDGAILSEGKIITLFHGKSTGTYSNSKCTTSAIELQIWDSEKLSKIQDVSYCKGDRLIKYSISKFNKNLFIKIGDYIISSMESTGELLYPSVERQPRLAIFDKHTLESRFITSYKGIRGSQWKSNLRFSYDFSKLYVLEADTYNGNAFPDSNYKTPSSKKTLVIDLTTLAASVPKVGWKKIESITVDLHAVKGGRRSLIFSRIGHYASLWNYLYDGVNRDESRFYLFDDGEAVLQNTKTKRLELTEYARKYLRMTNSKGKVVPMNEVTFRKYYSNKN